MAGWGWIGDLCIQQGRATALDTKKHLVGSVTFFVPDLVQGYLSCVRKSYSDGCGVRGRVAKWRASFIWPRNEIRSMKPVPVFNYYYFSVNDHDPMV